MQKKIPWLFVVVITLSMVLSACGGGAPTPEVQVEPTEVSAPEPVEEPTAAVVEEPAEEVVAEATEADLDAAFGALIATMKGYNALKDMAALSEMLASDTPPFVLDVRGVEELEEKGHIEGAVNVPLRDLAKHLDLLPSFDTPIVTYCGAGWRAAIAMTALQALGWNNVVALHAPSYTGWVEAGYPVVEGVAVEAAALDAAQADPTLVAAIDEMLSNIPENWGGITVDDLAVELAENPDLVVIDVRTPDEVAEGIVAGDNVVSIPLDDFVGMKDEWPADKHTPIITYCKGGHRSTMAMVTLWSYGYTDVRSLKGGYTAWTETEVAAGEPDLDGAFGTLISSMKGYNALKDMAALNEMLASDTPPFVLDVRSPQELEESGHIEGAVNLPLRELAQHLDLLPSFDTPIVTYCKGGWRAAIAMTALQALGWNNVVAFHAPSYTGWVEAGYPVVEGVAAEAMVLNAAQPDDALVDVVDQMLARFPENWGVVTSSDLAAELAENPDLIVIDVRTPDEVAEGVIAGENVVSLPLDDFVGLTGQWPADKDSAIVTYCKGGHRSTMAMSILRSFGFTNVRSLQGGFTAWQEAGYPVVELAAQ